MSESEAGGPALTRYRLDAAVQAVARVLTFAQPADTVLHGYFRAHPKLGAQDRAFIAETVFGLLRHHRTLTHHLGAATPRLLTAGYLAKFGGMSLRQLEPLLGEQERTSLRALRGAASEPPLAVAAELPDWLVERLRHRMSDSEILVLGRALAQPAPLDLRVNTLKAGRDEVLAALKAEGVAAAPTPFSPLGVRVPARTALQKHPLFLSGNVEVQDEGSQLLGFLVAPKRRELVVDFCAGAGGKTLMLGAMMANQGRVYAFDVSERRLARLAPRLKRSGLSNVHPQALSGENDNRVKRLAGKIDRVLVDAPCSGTGTLRRNPDLKWRQSGEGVTELAAKQRAILAAAAGLVKRGGRLVYATCSLLTEENRAIVDEFLGSHPEFRRLDAAEVLRAAGIPLDTGACLELAPDRHGTDGFFAAVMERAGG